MSNPANTTDAYMIIYSNRMGMKYEVNRFAEYSIDIDLEMDANGFNVVFNNPRGTYTGIFNKFDPIDIEIDGVKVMKGIIDDVDYIGDGDKNVMQIVGRDVTGIFVDNDALPETKYNVNPASYIEGKCKEYGISKYVLDKSVPVEPKLVIGAGESEISIMHNLVVENHRRIWSIYDTLYMGYWDTKAEPKYYFTRGVPIDQTGIPIKSIRLKDSGLDVKSEVRLYGSNSNGTEKLMATAKNEYLISKSIKKRRVARTFKNDGTSKKSADAMRRIREDFREGIELTITIKTPDAVILPNTTAHVIDRITKINSVFFIKSVNYSKNLSSGSITTIKMIPGDVTFDLLWQVQSQPASNSKTAQNNMAITGTPKLSFEELLKTRK